MFTYDINSTDPTLLIISKIRLDIGDTVEGNGVVPPKKTNYTDDEIWYYYSDTEKANSDFDEAVALIFDNLAVRWSGLEKDVTVREYDIDTKGIAENYRKMAKDKRQSIGATLGILTRDFQHRLC